MKYLEISIFLLFKILKSFVLMPSSMKPILIYELTALNFKVFIRQELH